MSQSSVEEQAALVALLRERPRGVTWARITDAILDAGSVAGARELITGEQGMLFPGPGASEHVLAKARADVLSWQSAGLGLWTILDDRYPARVRGIHEAPPFLFARGSKVDDDPGVCVVGSRQASARGLHMAQAISQLLVRMKLTVVAGLAAGIDTAAHEAALAAGGRTVAVIGTGINVAYPPANAKLQQQVAGAGLLLSQFWPDDGPRKHTFLMRNATMSGYALATIVVEAGEHSGARAQTRMAVGHGRPVVLTDQVVRANTWARELLGRPDVHHVSSLSQVEAIIADLRDRPTVVQAALSQLAI